MLNLGIKGLRNWGIGELKSGGWIKVKSDTGYWMLDKYRQY